MSRDALRAFLRLGMFVGVCGLLMVFMQPAGSAEFYISICSALIGLVIVLAVVALVRLDFPEWLRRLAARRSPKDEEHD